MHWLLRRRCHLWSPDPVAWLPDPVTWLSDPLSSPPVTVTPRRVKALSGASESSPVGCFPLLAQACSWPDPCLLAPLKVKSGSCTAGSACPRLASKGRLELDPLPTSGHRAASSHRGFAAGCRLGRRVVAPVAPAMFTVRVVPLGCAIGLGRCRVTWPHPPSWKVYSSIGVVCWPAPPSLGHCPSQPWSFIA
jgi:hypothetical protein